MNVFFISEVGTHYAKESCKNFLLCKNNIKISYYINNPYWKT